MKPTDLVISADSHVVEPPDLWVTRMDQKYRDSAPSVTETDKGFAFGGGGSALIGVAGVYSAGRNGQDLKDFYDRVRDAQLYEGARPSGWDPSERMADQDIDGVCAEVLYPSLGLILFSMTDIELQVEAFKTYNTWLAEYCSYNPNRLGGIAAISIEDTDAAVAEINRAATLGLKGVMIAAQPPLDRPFTGRSYDDVWAAAQDVDLPISLHVATAARKRKTDEGSGSFVETDPEKAKFAYIVSFVNVQHQIQRSLSAFIFSGVFDRFPKLRVVSAEHDIGWIPHFVARMDHAYEKYKESSNLSLGLTPGEYMTRNVWATFQDDPVGPALAEPHGFADNWMWASDFPHSDSTWPNSQAIIKRDIDPIGEPARSKIAFYNAKSFFKFDVG
jgi:predicted TIM-barrel fold metal-dependent hydrolase